MKAHFQIDDALTELAKSGNLFAELFNDNHISVEIYKPEQRDLQAAHNRDELYMIISGSGDFRLKDETFQFKPGDLFVVPQGAAHRFENFSEDFVTWVIFYGAVEIETEG